ncbi:hypothetical protein DH2020_010219 [Rehmannia glutinosa]|uniref:HMG box domain-containing protein n=1 Tax=Rehmannia glutinosa TaxID=99300 RepID=A0ABR0X9W8_REHGL
MANTNTSNHITELPPMQSPSAPSPSVPLHLCGFLTGDTVQVQGDTGELQFSVQFNVHKKEHHSGPSGEPFNFPDANIPEIGTFRDSVQLPPSSSYLSPTSTRENEDANVASEEHWSRGDVVTRLRSGVLSPVKYYRNGSYGVSRGSLGSERKKKAKKGKRKGDNVFEKMLKRRSFPLRPCNSYAFFLMANWGVVKRSSFEETSKRLSKQWYKLPHDKKKEYEDMALKDNARYKRQCVLLRNDVELQTGLVEDSN